MQRFLFYVRENYEIQSTEYKILTLDELKTLIAI